jgi:hypothetical protein
MSLTRRQALLAILAIPAGVAVQEKQGSSGNVITGTAFSRAMIYAVALNDLADANEHGGIYELQITYKGKSHKISAAELWEALTAPPAKEQAGKP